MNICGWTKRCDGKWCHPNVGYNAKEQGQVRPEVMKTRHGLNLDDIGEIMDANFKGVGDCLNAIEKRLDAVESQG
jgi:hypothetical protein